MFDRLRAKKSDPLDDQIAKVLEHMDVIGVDDQEYPTAIKTLSELTEVKKKSRRLPVSRDTLVTVGGSILSVIILMAYERHNVITSKAALGMVIKPRPN